MREKSHPRWVVDAGVARLADRQHRVVATRQLEELGLSPNAIARRVRSGWLHRIHHGVYAVGTPTMTKRGVWMAAVLACGPDAVLSHRSAAALHELQAARQTRVEVTVPRAGIRSRARLHVHRARGLDPADVTAVDGIPVTTVSRTLLDLASVVTRDRLLSAVEAAVQQRAFNLPAIDAAIAAAPRRRWVRKLRVILADYRQPPDLRSKFERDFFALIRRAGLPPPQTNVIVEGFRADCYWPHARLVVELDSVGFHSDASAFERDRIESNVLQRLGYRVLRVTHKRLKHDPQAVLQELQAFLELRPLPA